MKSIVLLEPQAGCLRSVKPFLSETGMSCHEFRSVDALQTSQKSVDLIILYCDNDIETFQHNINLLKDSPTFSRIPRLYVFSVDFNEKLPISEFRHDECSFKIPVDKLRFLTVVSKFLKRAHRRVFRTIITIQEENSNIRYSGMAIDFSDSGMAFQCSTDFTKGQKVIISFVDPKKRKRFSIMSVIARKAAPVAGTDFFYGVRFGDMNNQDLLDLTSFITGEK